MSNSLQKRGAARPSRARRSPRWPSSSDQEACLLLMQLSQGLPKNHREAKARRPCRAERKVLSKVLKHPLVLKLLLSFASSSRLSTAVLCHHFPKVHERPFALLSLNLILMILSPLLVGSQQKTQRAKPLEQTVWLQAQKLQGLGLME